MLALNKQLLSLAVCRLLLTAVLLSGMLNSVVIVIPVHADSTITVNTISDEDNIGADCSLREAITAANTNSAYGSCPAGSGTDTITFSINGTITLASTLPAISDNLMLDGTGQSITISGNNGLQILVVNSGKMLKLNLLTLANGTCPDCQGGAVLNFGTLNITGSTFLGNNATGVGDGGAIYAVSGSSTNVMNSTFENNSASMMTFHHGGAIANDGNLIVINSTFSGNSAANGGGIYNSGSMKVTNSTFSGNNSNPAGGAGMRSVGAGTVRNTIVANSPSGGNCIGNFAPGSTNNMADDNTCGFSFTQKTSAEINLGSLADNGGPTQTITLLAGSFAINVGNDSVCSDSVGDPTYGAGGLDQRGVTRPQGTHCDSGAFEAPGTPSILATTTYNGHTYHLLSIDTWVNSEAFAETLGGHLATVNDDAENTFLYNTFTENQTIIRNFWIGLNDVADEGSFVWTSGEPVTFTKWGTGEPNNNGGNEDYTHIFAPDSGSRSGFWNDSPGDGGVYGIVEIISNTTPTIDAGGPYDVNEGESVQLTATGNDPDGDTIVYVWDLDNNGTFETSGQIVTFSAIGLDGPSLHTISVRATDDGGLFAVDEATVNVQNASPAVHVPVVTPEPSIKGGSVTPSATFSDPAPNDAPFSCIIDYGDGSSAQSGTASGSTCTGPVHTYVNVGTYIVTVSVTDKDNGTGSNSTSHTVIYNFNGFFPPVDNLPVFNLVKAGQAIPVKLSLSGNQGLNIFAAGYPKSEVIQCDSNAQIDGIEETVTAGNSSLSYDPTTDTYIYVWKTNKVWANTCRQLVVKLNDGTFHRANFNFTR